MRNPPERRSSPVGVVIWSAAVVGLAALTLWHFEIWPLGFERTPTGTLAGSAELGDGFAATPIAVAELPPAEAAAPVAPAAPNPLPPPSEIAALSFEASYPAEPAIPAADLGGPSAPPATPDIRPRAGAGTRPAPAGGASSVGLTGADFASAGAFTQPRPPLPTVTPAAAPPPATPMPVTPPSTTPAPTVQTAAVVDAPAVAPSSNERPAAVPSPPPSVTPSPLPIDARLAAIDADIAAGRVLAAHKELSRLYWDEPGLRAAIAGRIDGTAKSIYFDPQPHYMPGYEVRPGDQLRLVARRYDVPWEYLGRVNRVDPARVRAGETLKVVKGPFAAVVDLSDFTLTVHAHGYYVRRYPVGVGQDGTTPVGTFHVLLKEANPKYWGPDGVTMERDDPANPLGERWLALDDGQGRPTSYGVHGTIDPGSIGKAESRGCVRLRNEDVAEVYDLLGVGSEVVIQR